MTPEEFDKQQRAKIKELLDATNQEIMTAHLEKVERIYERGELGDSGTQRFAYQGAPLYVNPSNAPRGFTPAGNPSAKRKKKKPKTKWFPSYGAYRAAVGRQPVFVDLTLFGTLRSDHTSALTRTTETQWIERLKNPKNQDKLAGAIGKYGTFTNPTKKELDSLVTRILERRKTIGI